jgi:hypothetical protein
VIERRYAEGVQILGDEPGAHTRHPVTENNLLEGVTWLHSYVSPDKRRSFCVYDGPSPEAIRRAASRNKLPVHEITEVLILDPYSCNQKGDMP